jgi:hypothetical protein
VRIRYEYCDASGQKHQGRAGVSWEYYEAVKVGDPVKVVYLPQRPSVSALLAEVELVRRAHQRKAAWSHTTHFTLAPFHALTPC